MVIYAVLSQENIAVILRIFECRCKLKDKYEEWFHHENFTHYKYIEMNIETVGLSIVA